MENTSGLAAGNGVELRWEHYPASSAPSEGQNPMPLLLVNGLGSPMVAYDLGFVEEFNNRGFDVVRFDNRDAGRSTATNGGYGLGDMAADARSVMSAVDWDEAHVFGMSMGGMIVQQMAIDHPDSLLTVTSVMSATGNPDYGASSEEALVAIQAPAPTEREAWINERTRSEKIWASPAEFNEATSRTRGEMLFDYGAQPEQVKHQFAAIINAGSRDDELSTVEVPTLVLHGSEDTLIGPSGGRHTAEVMPNARYVELEGMGHDLPAAYWPAITDLVHGHAVSQD